MRIRAQNLRPGDHFTLADRRLTTIGRAGGFEDEAVSCVDASTGKLVIVPLTLIVSTDAHGVHQEAG